MEELDRLQDRLNGRDGRSLTEKKWTYRETEMEKLDRLQDRLNERDGRSICWVTGVLTSSSRTRRSLTEKEWAYRTTELDNEDDRKMDLSSFEFGNSRRFQGDDQILRCINTN